MNPVSQTQNIKAPPTIKRSTLALLLLASLSTPAWGAGNEASATSSSGTAPSSSGGAPPPAASSASSSTNNASADAKPKTSQGSSDKEAKERNFYEVLEDVLADFEYDLRNNNVSGLRDLAIKNIATSEGVPPSFKSHLELLVTERIIKTSKTRVVQCIPCRAKKTTLNGDQVVISATDTNPNELARLAKSSSIAHFMDIAFAYQPSGMILSMYITEPETGSVVWSRSYNSEMSQASAMRRGVDFSQVDANRKQTEYAPTKQYRIIAYYLFQPNVSGVSGTLGLGFRMMERYDNRKKEVGFEFDYFRDASSLVVPASASTSSSTNLWGGINGTLLFMHAWNLIGEEENFNKVRGSFNLGVGGTYTSGYLGGLIRAQYEWRLGKHFSVSGSLGYRPQASAFLTTSSSTGTAISGAEYGLGISMLF